MTAAQAESFEQSSIQSEHQPEQGGVSSERFHRVTEAVGAEPLSEGELQQLQFTLTESSNALELPPEKVLGNAIEDFALGQAVTQEIIRPPNPFRKENELRKGKDSLHNAKLEDAQVMAKNLRLKLKDETLEDYLAAADKFAGKGQYVGMSSLDLLGMILAGVYRKQNPEPRDIFKSVRIVE